MRGKTCWQSRPYRPFNRQSELANPLIVRLAPWLTGVEIEWIDVFDTDSTHHAYLRPIDTGVPFKEVVLNGNPARIDGLTPYQDYEICITRNGAKPTHNCSRLFRAVNAPGVVVNYLHPRDDFYSFSGKALCSPSLVRLPSGALLASMDVYVGRGAQNLTILFRSEDRGKSWRYVADLHPLFWANLFIHNGRLFAMGCSTEFGDLIIGASDDEGITWTTPSHILYGSSTVGEGWEQAPMPILHANGRIYTSIEYGQLPDVGVCVISAQQDSDLLDPASWSITPPLYLQNDWPGKPIGDCRMILEGNVLQINDGKLINILRVQATNCIPDHGVALVLNVDSHDPEAPLKFNRFLQMPSGSNSKTFIRFDKQSRTYYAIGNICTDPSTPSQRSVLSLLTSRDAMKWDIACNLIDFRHERANEVGFQYPFFIFDGNDILFECRTAIGGARNFHDANFATFHIIENFRDYAL